MTAIDRDQDAKRFQSWQLDTVQARPKDSELTSAGPFQAVISTSGEPSSWVTLIDGAASETEIAKGVTKLRSTFKKRKIVFEIEYNETAFPAVGTWLESAGFKLHERNQLMACRPDYFKPYAAPGVELTRLTPTSKPAELQAFQGMRWTGSTGKEEEAPPIERLHSELAGAGSVFLLAWLDWEPAGTGISHSLNGAAEIVGVATRADMRRRGVAATVSSSLVARHFESGGDFVFLDAATDGAAKVYEKLGFTTFGANLIYR